MQVAVSLGQIRKCQFNITWVLKGIKNTYFDLYSQSLCVINGE